MRDAVIVIAVKEAFGITSRHFLGVLDETTTIGTTASLWRTPKLRGEICEELFPNTAPARRR